MRITKISVKKLFGVFDHEIPLNQESRITIIHGPNGVGKTVLMKMIDGLFSAEYEIFSSVPFESFTVELASGERIRVPGSVSEYDKSEHTVEVDDGEDSVSVEIPKIYYHQNEESKPEIFVPKKTPESRQIVLEKLESMPELYQVNKDRWEEIQSGDVMDLMGASKAYGLQGVLFNEPDWLKKIKTRFIQEQRLQEPESPGRYGYTVFPPPRRRRASSTPRATVVRYSKEVAKIIGDALEAYGQKSQILDRSFPRRVMSAAGKTLGEDLQVELSKLDGKRKELMDLGLLEREDDKLLIHPRRSALPDEKSNTEQNVDRTEVKLERIFFATYVEDIEQKLSVFDDISEKLRILTTILNRRFQYKTLTIDEQKEFVIVPDVKTNDKSSISITSLSSGEQHELVLLYQLLFHVQQDSLIMIDEPELSLHVTWQRSFLSDIEEIIKVRQFDVLIATHSPQIIHDKWDWMVDLHNPDGELDEEAE